MTAQLPGSNSLLNKRMPTIAGLVLLIIAMILGVVFIGDGVGVFAPRATPETTPKQVRVTNVTDRSFTISFMTDEATTAFVRYGTEAEKLSSQQTDDRNRVSNTTERYTLHHITIRNLEPNSSYYYILGTGSGARFDNNGTPFRVVTARRSGTPTAARTVYGSVSTDSGAPAQGAVVYLATEAAGEMSSLVQASGAWAIPLSDARTSDGAEYAKIANDATLQLFVQGPNPSQTASVTTIVEDAQPVPTITYGQTGAVSGAESTTAAQPSPSPSATPLDISQATTSTGSARLPIDGPEAVEEKLVFDLDTDDDSEPPVLTTEQPVIRGTIEPGVTVKVTVNSENQITAEVITNEDGTFEIDIASLQGRLEPGEHTIRLEFVNPQTGLDEVITRTFYVAPQNATTQIAQATPVPTPVPTRTPSPSPTPFGTDSPFPIDPSATQGAGLQDGSGTGSATGSASATDSARGSMPSTSSGVPVSGSVGTTLALIFGGMFFIISGAWSYWVSKNYAQQRAA